MCENSEDNDACENQDSPHPTYRAARSLASEECERPMKMERGHEERIRRRSAVLLHATCAATVRNDNRESILNRLGEDVSIFHPERSHWHERMRANGPDQIATAMGSDETAA